MSTVTENIHQGAIGVQIAVLVKDRYDGEALPLNGASVKDFYIRKPGATTTVKWTAEFDNGTGDDGWLRYTTIDGDLDDEGRYVGQTHVEKAGLVLPSSWFDFWVHPSLPAPG